MYRLIIFCVSIFWGSCGTENLENPFFLQLGDSYYLMVTEIEVPPRPDVQDKLSLTSKWDDVGVGAPDVFYKLYYKGEIHYTSSVAEDTIHASFSPFKGGLGKAFFEKNSSQYLEASLIKCYDLNALLEFQIMDKDLTDDDEIGILRIHLNSIKEGKNTQIDESGITLVFFAINTKYNLNQQLSSLGIIPGRK